jgi:hypothetical protein
MRGFGRSWRGQGRVCVKRVRHTAHPRLALGAPRTRCGLKAKECLDQTLPLGAAQRQRLTLALPTAMNNQEDIRQPSPRLTHGNKLPPCQLVHAYDPTIAPSITGKSTSPGQCGRKPGLAAAPATGFLFATLVPPGHPSDPRSVVPWLDKVPRAVDRVRAPKRLQLHAVAGALGVHDTARRQALHARGMLTLGLPKPVEPSNSQPTAEERRDLLNAAG